jgi:hypothetical protein
MARGFGQDLKTYDYEELALEVTPAILVAGGTIATLYGEIYDNNTSVVVGGIMLSLGMAIPSFRILKEWSARRAWAAKSPYEKSQTMVGYGGYYYYG